MFFAIHRSKQPYHVKPDTPGKSPHLPLTVLSITSLTPELVYLKGSAKTSQGHLTYEIVALVSLITYTPLALSPQPSLLSPPSCLFFLLPNCPCLMGPLMMTTQVDVSSVLTKSCEEMYVGVRDLV